VAGIDFTVITGSEGGGIAPCPASAFPFLHPYKRIIAASEKPEALNDHKISGRDWVRFILQVFEMLVV
jgi:hypothetical protein